MAVTVCNSLLPTVNRACGNNAHSCKLCKETMQGAQCYCQENKVYNTSISQCVGMYSACVCFACLCVCVCVCVFCVCVCVF